MEKKYKKASSSYVTLTQLMLPSHSNFSGKIHGGFLLGLMDQVAFASASKFSETYCVTASVDRVDFLQPVDVGELVTLKASVNYVGNTSMVVGIRVDAQHIQTGNIKHCNSSYFTMIAKDQNGKNMPVPRMILTTETEIRRYHKSISRIQLRDERGKMIDKMEPDLNESIDFLLKNYDVQIVY